MRGNLQTKARRQDVVTLDRSGFEDACADLMAQVTQDFRPDALIGIRTGGFYVAEAMARSAGSALPVLPLTCRRASTAIKEKSGAFKALVARLPRPLVDRLRVWEHAMLTRGGGTELGEPYRFDPDELSHLDRWLSCHGRGASLLIVDDAVDTGATLAHVMEAVAHRAPDGADIRSAVITVTTPQPRISPWYRLYDQQLCRFPWSFDA